MKKNKDLNYIDIEKISYVQEDASLRDDGFNALVNDMKKVISHEDINIILLHLIDDLTFVEIAMKLNQNEKTIKTKYYRALKKYKRIKGVDEYEKN